MKKVQKKFYDKDMGSYFLVIGGSLIGLFDSEGNVIGRVAESSLDMYKLTTNEGICVVRHLKRKGLCLMYQISDNDIVLSNPTIYSALVLNRYEYANLWEGIDI